MANTQIFTSSRGPALPAANILNNAGGAAYQFSSAHKLAQFAVTGCFNNTFYAGGQDQLDAVKELCKKVDPEVLAKVALYSRKKGHMKDMPAFMAAMLLQQNPELFKRVFNRVIDDSRMLRNFVQIIRSGQTGRKSFGTLPKRMILDWLESRSDEQLFRQSIGDKPSLADIIKMVHPRPATKSREALYGYLLNKQPSSRELPPLVQEYERFKSGKRDCTTPDVPFQMLTSLQLSREDWTQIARRASWQTLRMNLNTFARHGVFEDERIAQLAAQRLSDPLEIAKARPFPYQLLVAARASEDNVPAVIRRALEQAMEVAASNIPRFEGKVVVCPDVSGSMQSPVTGRRGGGIRDTTVRCVDVAALYASAVLRINPDGIVLPFEQDVVQVKVRANDTVLTNAERLAAVGGGGTNVSAPLRYLNKRAMQADTVIFVSDNESWVDSSPSGWRRRATATMQEWNEFKSRNPRARLVCIDIQPNTSTQASDREDILNVGGFSDNVFSVVADFAAGRHQGANWLKYCEEMELSET